MLNRQPVSSAVHLVDGVVSWREPQCLLPCALCRLSPPEPGEIPIDAPDALYVACLGQPKGGHVTSMQPKELAPLQCEAKPLGE